MLTSLEDSAPILCILMIIIRYHYIMGKCMGKLEKERKVGGGEDRQCYTPDQVLESDREVNCGKNQQCYTPEEVLEQYARSIKYAPEKTGSELLPEPHHKLVSAACKYVLNDKIQVSIAPFSHSSFSHNCLACCCV